MNPVVTPESHSPAFKEVQDYFMKAAIETIHYIAAGTVFHRDIMEKHKLTADQTRHLLAVVADALTLQISKIKIL